MKRNVWVTVVVVAVLVAGCSDSGSDTTSTTSGGAASEQGAGGEATTTKAAASPEDELREVATAHWDDYQSMDVDALFAIQTERCQEVNSLQDFEANFANVDEDRLAALEITITDVAVDGDRGDVTVEAVEPSGEAVGTEEVQKWLFVDGEWRQDDC